MKSSPQRHFERTAQWSHGIVFFVFVAGLGVVLALNADRLYAANPGVKGAVALAILLVLAWPRHVFGELVCEIVRECTRAQCPQCGGPAKAHVELESAHYACQTCGHQEPIKLREGSRFEYNGGPDGLGGGGG